MFGGDAHAAYAAALLLLSGFTEIFPARRCRHEHIQNIPNRPDAGVLYLSFRRYALMPIFACC